MARKLLIPAFAKLNLSLEILGRRDDGYHLLETVFQSVDLADRLTVQCNESGRIELRVEARNDDMLAVTDDESNLVVKAARRFTERWAPERGVLLGLEKNIPVGAGLGGGSSDAATTLLALRALLRPELPIEPLQELAAELGADVPFFLVGGTAHGSGRGDVIRPLPPIASTELVLVVPPVFVSTARVFEEYARRTESEGASSRLSRLADRSISLRQFDDYVRGNDLQRVCFDLYDSVERVYTAVNQSLVHNVQLSGSGGCVFGRFPASLGEQQFADWEASLPADSRVYRVRTLSADQIRERQKLET